jgi:hypothetical protein
MQEKSQNQTGLIHAGQPNKIANTMNPFVQGSSDMIARRVAVAFANNPRYSSSGALAAVRAALKKSGR